MNLLKIITILNWVVIAILFFLVAAETLFPTKGGDAAGRGMGQAIYYLALIALLVLLVLNILPYKWAKYAAFVLIAVPIVFFQLSPVWQKIKRTVVNVIEESKPIFPDTERDQAARAIYDGKPEQLRKILQEPLPRLNEGGAILTLAITSITRFSDKPEERLECLRMVFQAGARLDSLDGMEVPIHFAVADVGSAALLHILLENGADANAVHRYFKRAIIFEALASYQEPEASVRALLDFGANPNVTAVLEDEQGPTSPLVRAAELGRWGVCVALLEKGADAKFKTKNELSLQTFVDQANQEFSADGYSTREDFERLKKVMQ